MCPNEPQALATLGFPYTMGLVIKPKSVRIIPLSPSFSQPDGDQFLRDPCSLPATSRRWTCGAQLTLVVSLQEIRQKSEMAVLDDLPFFAFS